jgi:hypothetical protein
MPRHLFIVDSFDVVGFKIFSILETAFDWIIGHDIHSILSHRNLKGKNGELSACDEFLNKTAPKLIQHAFALDTKVFDVPYFLILDETNARVARKVLGRERKFQGILGFVLCIKLGQEGVQFGSVVNKTPVRHLDITSQSRFLHLESGWLVRKRAYRLL